MNVNKLSLSQKPVNLFSCHLRAPESELCPPKKHARVAKTDGRRMGTRQFLRGNIQLTKTLRQSSNLYNCTPPLPPPTPPPRPTPPPQKKWLVVRTRAITIISHDLQVRCVFDVKTTGFGYETLRKARRTATRWQVCNGNEHDRCDVATGCWPQLEGPAIDLDLLRSTCISL